MEQAERAATDPMREIGQAISGDELEKMWDIGNLIQTFELLAAKCDKKMHDAAKLYRGQLRLLTKIRENPGITLVELSKRTGVGQSSLSQSLRNMERQGTAVRERDKVDTRCQRLYITPRGIEALDEGHRCGYALMNSIIHDFTPEEFETFSSLLRRVFSHMNEFLET